jgi:hypothetical protein
MDSVSLSHHTVVEIAAKFHEPSMQFLQYITAGYFTLEFHAFTRLRTGQSGLRFQPIAKK